LNIEIICYHIKIERRYPVQENKGGGGKIIITLWKNIEFLICSLKIWKNNICLDRYNDYWINHTSFKLVDTWNKLR